MELHWYCRFSVAAYNGVRITRSVIADCFEMKRYGVDKSPLGAFKATRQITQVPQDPGSFRAFVDANEKDGLVHLLYSNVITDSIVTDS